AFMAAALAVFAAGKRSYGGEDVGGRAGTTAEERQQQRRTLAGLFGIFLLLVFFWIVYGPNDNLWGVFARGHMDRTLPSWLGGGEVAPDQFQFVNAALILALVPFAQWFWPRVDPTGRRFPHATKILIGLLFTATAPAVMAAAGYLAADGAKVSMGWICAAYF